MNKEELRAKLDELGVKYDKRWGEKKLEAALEASKTPVEVVEEPKEEYTPEEVQNIADAIMEKEKPPAEVAFKNVGKTLDGRWTTNGIVIPGSALAGIRKVQWTYWADISLEEAQVGRTAPNGYEEDIRLYSKTRHGDNFVELAKQFVDKNNLAQR